jgi:hypothetical protein
MTLNQRQKNDKADFQLKTTGRKLKKLPMNLPDHYSRHRKTLNQSPENNKHKIKIKNNAHPTKLIL